jgi:hypothetical protein
MTDIDPRADIEVHPADAGVTVRIPLAGPVAGGWLQCYQQLATAFSPTDVMPLARWGKLAMTVQAVSSLMILGPGYRAGVNILQ